MSILKRANKTYTRLFWPYRFTANRIYQSKAIQIDMKQYVLVGQVTEKHSPIITNYMVYDTSEQVANDELAKKVYQIVCESLMMEHILPLTDLFSLQEKLEPSNTQEKAEIGPVTTATEIAWKSTALAYEKWINSKILLESNWREWHKYWEDFWTVYEERATYLMMLPKSELREAYKKKDRNNKKAAIINEARLVASLFTLRGANIEESPSHLNRWIDFNSRKALASNREVIISTKADKQSEKIMRGFGYILMLGIILPFFLYRTYVDGGEHIFYLCLFFAIYFALYYTNKYRLRKSIHVRLADIWQLDEAEENIPIFHVSATSLTMAVNTAYASIATIMIFASFWYIYGLAHGITIFTLILMLFTISLNIWLLYSPFVEKDITFYVHKLRAGHRIFPVKDMRQISVDKDDITYTLYLTYTKEPYELYIEKADRKQMKTFMEKWTEANNIPFTLFNKEDRYN